MSATRTFMTAALAAALTGLGLTHASAATQECTALSIVDNQPGCIQGWLDVTVDADANVLVSQVNSIHRGAFEEYVLVFEGWEGSLDEYFEVAFGGPATPGTTYQHTIGQDQVTFTIEAVLSQESGDALALGFWAEDNEVLAVIDSWAVVGVDSMTATFPGPVADSNGTTDGNVVTWDADTIAANPVLTATAGRFAAGAPSPMPWVLIGVGGAVTLVGVGVAARGLRRRRRTN